MLVTYHVIGADSEGGLEINGVHPLRLFADFFVDLRMPLFAAIAGYVYGLKPVSPTHLFRFITGKFRRLALPGAVAITVFMLASMASGTRFAPAEGWWLNYVMPYAHFWFLQAILLIFVLVCSLDILLKGRFLWLFVVLACAVSLSGVVAPMQIMSINQAIYLLPYFLAGTLACRHLDLLWSNRALVVGIALLLAVIATWINLQQFEHTRTFATDRRDLQSLAFGMGGAALCLMLLPGIAGRRLGAFGYTIYLYHVLATSATRRLLEAAGVDNLVVNLLIGVAAGIGVPVVLHLLAMRHPWSAMLVLGERRNRPRHKVAKNIT